LKKSSVKGALAAENFYRKYKNTSIKFYALTASGDDEIEIFRQKTGVTFPFYKTDAIQLKTMVRANPGMVLIKNGNVEGKWNWRDFE
jgi:triosephosphate isomerase